MSEIFDHMFNPALFAIIRKWNQETGYSPTDEWVKKTWYFRHNGIFFRKAHTKNTPSEKLMELKIIVLTKINQI